MRSFFAKLEIQTFPSSSYDEDGNELPALEVEDPYKNDYQQVRERGVQVL